ncbi:MAG: AMP-binding protein [Spirochaetia bacterium]|nr:AMP-binding protein [Spirochaetia bacterium]MCF7946744.1 AMP-binding protein [Spirochaetia bacterium]MCF7952456.1 AMP-binding protein [Spirochaetales bacterium]
MIHLEKYTLAELFEKSTAAYADQPFGGFIDEEQITYKEWEQHALHVKKYLEASRLGKNNNIALLGENSPAWSAAYFGIVLSGNVAVPILPDFTQKEVQNILEHAEAEQIFVSKKQVKKVKEVFSNDQAIVLLDELLQEKEHGESSLALKGCEGITKDTLASIIYTSGTTGVSKGVMLTHGNLCSNAMISSTSFIKILPEDNMLSVLPMSHSYEFTIGLLLGMIGGVHFNYLRKPPSASMLLPALKKVRPQIMLSVPLLIEKLYRASVLPKIEKKKILKMLYKISLFRKMINRKVGKQLKEVFGGRLKFFGIGGAPLDPMVERFLFEAKFPYGIGYGLTETAPLLAGCAPGWTKIASTGKVLDNVQMRVQKEQDEEVQASEDTQDGEIQVKGPNVMLGYYKNPEETKKVFTEDGWFKTGDLGVFDKKGYLFIKGRKKNMILGPSGENIYPELIENMLNNYDFVEESLVLSSNEGITARIKIDVEEYAKNFRVSADQAGEHVKEYLDNIRKRVNKELNVFSKINHVIHQKESFIRTPTKKIKRYLYDIMHKK